MTIKVGDKLPEAKFRVMTAEGPQVKTTDDIFKGKKVALFAVPGAYTGTCHKMHLPSIFLNAYAIKDKGVNTIAIVSVNDAFVMNAWKRDTDQRDEAIFLADGNAEFTKAIGMELDASGNGLGIRSKRYSMLVEDGQDVQSRAGAGQGRGFRRRYAAGAAVGFRWRDRPHRSRTVVARL
jgi:peroxiredoxin